MPSPQLTWQAAFALGLVTLALGIVVVIRPTQSLTVIAILLGVAMIASGIFHIVRAFGGRANEPVWRSITGVLFILAGLVLLRHLHLSVALIGLFIGFSWIIQGVMSLMEAVTGRGRGRRDSTGWAVFFGVISLAAGIVVVSSPIASVATLTIFMGIWLIVMGIMEMAGAFVIMRSPGRSGTGRVNVPGQRPGEPESAGSAPRGAAAGDTTARDTAARDAAPGDTAPAESEASEEASRAASRRHGLTGHLPRRPAS
jgi:uncharacterized membrane protein HdeD (DUF308 family)